MSEQARAGNDAGEEGLHLGEAAAAARWPWMLSPRGSGVESERERVATSGDRGSRRERSTLGLSAVRGAISSGPPPTPFQRRRRRQCGSESIGSTTELSLRGGFHPTSLKVKPDAQVILEMPHLESFVVPFPGLGSGLRLMITFVKLGGIRHNS